MGSSNNVLNPPSFGRTDYANVMVIRYRDADTLSMIVYPYDPTLTLSPYVRSSNVTGWAKAAWKQYALKDDFVVKTYNAFQNGVTGYLYFEKNNITKICHCTGFLGTVPSGITYVLQVDSSLFPSVQITRQVIKNDVSTIINGIIDFRTDGGLRIRSLDSTTSGNFMIDFSFKTT